MTTIKNIMRTDLKEFFGYESSRSIAKNDNFDIRLDANESPFKPSFASDFEPSLNRYPDPRPDDLVNALGRYYNLSAQELLLGRGSDELIDLITRLVCISGQDSVLIPKPGFSFYESAARLQGAKISSYTLREEQSFALTADALLDKWEEGCKIVYLCTPSNPTGASISLAVIEEICSNLTGKSIVVVDEAYVEFSSADSATSLIGSFDNLIVLRTFSKAMGLAGIRLGCAISCTDNIKILQRICAPYPIPTPTRNIALRALQTESLLANQDKVDLILKERQRMREVLNGLPVVERVFASDANFLLVKLKNSERVFENLKQASILVRDQNWQVANCLRVSIGTQKENDLFLKALGAKVAQRENRTAQLFRATNETSIEASINLDQPNETKIETGIEFLDHMLEQLAFHSTTSIKLYASGDLYVDDHHLVEDCALVLGSLIKKALGQGKGIERYGFVLPMDDACSTMSLDLCGRFVYKQEGDFGQGMLGALSVEMVSHFFYSFASKLECNLQLKIEGDNRHHKVESAFKALGRCLKQALSTQAGGIPSTKGVIT